MPLALNLPLWACAALALTPLAAAQSETEVCVRNGGAFQQVVDFYYTFPGNNSRVLASTSGSYPAAQTRCHRYRDPGVPGVHYQTRARNIGALNREAWSESTDLYRVRGCNIDWRTSGTTSNPRFDSHSASENCNYYPGGDPNECAAENVIGSWRPKFPIASTTSIGLQYGVSKTDSRTTTQQWNQETSATVTASIGLSAFGVTAGGGAEVGSSIGMSLTNAYSESWTMSQTETFMVTFEREDVGKFVWQFEFDIDDTCLGGKQPATRAFAITAGAFQEPCCVPGYCVDGPNCGACFSSEFMFANPDRRCQVGTKEYALNGTVNGLHIDFTPETQFF